MRGEDRKERGGLHACVTSQLKGIYNMQLICHKQLNLFGHSGKNEGKTRGKKKTEMETETETETETMTVKC